MLQRQFPKSIHTPVMLLYGFVSEIMALAARETIFARRKVEFPHASVTANAVLYSWALKVITLSPTER